MWYTIFISVIILILSIFIYKYKLPILCYGCESPSGLSKYIFRCVVDSTENSELCKLTKSIDNSDFKSMATQAWGMTSEAFDELAKTLPETIKNAFINIYEKIKNITGDIITKIKDFGSSLKNIFLDLLEKIKNKVFKNLEQFYNALIKPIIDTLNTTIITPIKSLINLLTQLKTLILNSVNNIIEKMGNPIPKIIDTLNKTIMVIPNGLKDMFSTVIGLIFNIINEVSCKSAQGINTGLREMTKFTNGVVTFSEDALNKGIGEIDGVLKKVEIGLKEKVIEPVLKATKEVINGVSKVTDPMVEGLGKVKNWEIPEVAIPELVFPGIEWGKVFPGAGTSPSKQIIPRTKIFGPEKPFWSMLQKMDENWRLKDNVSIPEKAEFSMQIPKTTGNKYVNYNYRPLEPPSIPEKDCAFAKIPDLSFINKITEPLVNEIKKPFKELKEQVWDPVQEIFNKAIEPINIAIRGLQALIEAIPKAIEEFVDKYLNWNKLAELWNKLIEYMKIDEILEIVLNTVIDPINNLIGIIKDAFNKIIDIVVSEIKLIFEPIFKDVSALFKKISDVLFEVGSKLLKNIGYTILYFIVKMIDILIPLPVIKTVKINLVLFILVLFIIFQLKMYVDNWMLTLGAVLLLAIMAFTFGSETTTKAPIKSTTTEKALIKSTTTEKIEVNKKIETYINLNDDKNDYIKIKGLKIIHINDILKTSPRLIIA